MSYALRIPNNLEEAIVSWRLPKATLTRLAAESKSPSLVAPPFPTLKTVEPIQGIYRWTFIDKVEEIRIDFTVRMNEESKFIEVEQCWCLQPSGVVVERVQSRQR